MNKMKWLPGLALENANGAVDPATTGYQYTIQTTTAIRARVIEQKFYTVPIADFFPVIVGFGAYMEDIKTNLVYDVAGPFEQGIISTASGPAQIGHVDVATAPKTAKLITWAKGYLYTMVELKKALASNNWDVVTSKLSALKRHWDLGLQKIGFLGLKGDASVPGLYTNSGVTVDTTTITANISTMSAADFQTLVANILDVFFENSNKTVLPNTFVMPMSDYLGMASAASPDFPMVSKLDYLVEAFRKITGDPNFQVKGTAYGDASMNAGYVSTPGKSRYILYKNDPEALAMDIPVDFNLTPAGTSNNFQWQGVGVGQFGGCIVYIEPWVMYFDHS